MSDLESRFAELEARLSARAAELESRIASRSAHAPRGAAALPGERASGARLPDSADPSAKASSDGTRYGLYVGVNKYSVPCRPLSGCVADARNLAAVCRDLGGWKERNQTVMLDSRATVGAIRGALRELAEKAKPGDVVLYFQSSHGGPNGVEPASNDTCLWGHDGRYEEAELWSDLSRFRKGVKIVVMVDACYSGGLFEKFGPKGAAEPVHSLPARIGERFLAADPDDADRVSPADIGWITAADNGQTSLDHGEGGGYFTTLTVVNNGWRAGMAAGMADKVIAATGRSAVLSSAAALSALRAGAAKGASGGDRVTFLDLAVFALSVWVNWVTADDGEAHVPQFANPDLLHSVVAGRSGASPT